MKDTETRDRLLGARKKLYDEYEAETKKYIVSPNSEEGKQAELQRETIAAKLRTSYWELDPYLRSRSIYDRLGQLQPGGGIDWYIAGDCGEK
jgi:predicted transcriptional regulator